MAAVRQPVLALPLHAAVLEPDLDLAFGEAERVRDLDPATPGEVAVEVELLLQLERLVARVGRPRALRVVVRARRERRRRRRRLTSAADAAIRRCSARKPTYSLKAKFHYAIWSQTGPKLVANLLDRASLLLAS